MNLCIGNKIASVDMKEMIKKIISDYGIEGKIVTPANEKLFNINENEKILSNSEKEKFHTFTAKLLYVARKVRPDILTAVSFLTTRVNSPNECDKLKLERVIKYLNYSIEKEITFGNIFETDGSITIKCYIDTSHGIHHDMRGHVGCIIKIGKSSIITRSTKMKLNTKSTAETELIGMSEESIQALWIRNFLIDNNYKINKIIIYQDNLSTITLIEKGKPCSRNTKHINMRYFFIKDYINQNIISVKYLNTDSMIADVLTKPLSGIKFNKFTDAILNAF
jgi:hypothetical protein